MMSNNTSLSVLITYYNERELLTDCLDSLRAGGCLPDEILIYDDASDYPPESFIPHDMKVQIIRGKMNVGPGCGRNILLQKAMGDYIHFHDSDDWFHPDWCRVVTDRLKISSVDALFTEVTSSKTNVPDFMHPFMGYERVDVGMDLTAFAIEQTLLVPSSTIRRECALRIDGFRAGLWQSEDKDFYIRLAASGVSWEVEQRPLICIRSRPGSRSRRQVEVWKDGLKCLEHAREELPPHYRSHVANAAAKCAYQLYVIGEKAAAREALQLCEELGGTSYSWRAPGFRVAAKCFGSEIAEAGSLWLQRIKRDLWRLQ